MYQFTTPAPLPAHERAALPPATAKEMKIGSKVEGQGPAIVLLHSSMGSKSPWRTLVKSMRGTHRLIAIDLYGYGVSPMPESRDRHSLSDEVRLVQSKLAQLLAHASPDRVRSLALYEPTAFHLLDREDPVLDDIRAVAHVTRDGHSAGAAEMFINYWSGKGTYATLPPAMQALFIALLPKVPLDFQALIDDPMRPSDYRLMNVPSCLIAGRHSPRCTQAIVSVLTASLQKGGRHEIDAGHMSPVSHPALVNPIIQNFIHRIDSQPCTDEVSMRKTSAMIRAPVRGT